MKSLKTKKKSTPQTAGSLRTIAHFLFEMGILAKTPRSGFHFLGTGSQSVAEHVNRTVFVGYALAHMDGGADISKVLKMCLLHDIGESRISDLNYVHQKYVEKNEAKAIADVAASVPFGDDIQATITEYEAHTSKESLIAKDADNIEWILSLKEQVDTGNTRAKGWIVPAVRRLKTPHAIALVKVILETDSNDWWFEDKDDDWWVNRANTPKHNR